MQQASTPSASLLWVQLSVWLRWSHYVPQTHPIPPFHS